MFRALAIGVVLVRIVEGAVANSVWKPAAVRVADEQSTAPTLQETIGWISERLIGAAEEYEYRYRQDDGPSRHLLTWSLVSSKGCTITLETNWRTSDPHGETQMHGGGPVEIVLGAVRSVDASERANPSSAYVTYSFPRPIIDVRLSGNGIAIGRQTGTIVETGRTETETVRELKIGFTDRELANKFVNAFSHAAKLCAKDIF